MPPAGFNALTASAFIGLLCALGCFEARASK